jgi:hypothetical protein
MANPDSPLPIQDLNQIHAIVESLEKDVKELTDIAKRHDALTVAEVAATGYETSREGAQRLDQKARRQIRKIKWWAQLGDINRRRDTVHKKRVALSHAIALIQPSQR